MKKQLSIGLILIMLITMIAPVQVFAEETQKGCLFYRLDPSTNIENPYSYRMSVSALVNGLGNSSETNLDYYMNYNYAEYYVGDTFDFDVTVSSGSLQVPVTQHYSIDTSFSQNQILTIKFDPMATGNEIGITYDALPVDVVFSHEDLSYGVSYSYEGSNTIFSYRAIGSGNYKVFYSKKENETEIVSMEDVVVDGSINQITSIASAPDTTFDVQATSSGFDNLSSNIYYNQKFLSSLNGASQVKISPVDTSIRFEGVIGQNQVSLDMPFATLINSIDLTKLLATTGSENNFSGYFNINDAYDFTDANHNPLLISYIGMGNYSLDLGNGNIFSGDLNGGYIDINNISGSGTLTINIPELGIDNVATPVTVSSGGQPPQNNNYKGFSFNIVNPDTNAPIPGVYSTYNASKNICYIYIPENLQALVEVKGINSDDSYTDILPMIFDGSEHPQYGYDNNTHIMTLGGVQGGYGDMWFGRVNDEANISVNVYSGKMGILTLENTESTVKSPSYFSGEVNYAIGYQMTNGNGSGSMSNGEVIEGKLFIPIQADALGIDYMYTVVSPTQGNSATPQANTPFIDLTNKLSNEVNGFIDLGSSRFQSPIFKGEVYDKNNQPVDYTHVNTMVLYQGTELGLNLIWFSPATVKNSQGILNTFYLAPFGTDFSNTLDLNISSYMGTIKPIDAQVNLFGDDQQFVETADQIEVQMLTPDGQNAMEQGQGLDRHIYLVREFDYKEIFIGNTSTAMLSGFVEGETYTIYVAPDQGDFDYLEYFDGPRVTFVYTEIEGSYIATDSQGNDIPFTVDSNGLMHLSLRIGKAQVYGNITMNNQPYQNDIYMTLYDKVTQNVISQGFAHTTGGYNGQPVEHGVFVLGSDETLSGEYTLVVSDPSDTVDYSGTSVDITLPLTGPLTIDLPKSKVFGSVVLSDADQLLYGENIMRVFVNVFDASGEFVKNVLVRRDGKFTVGELTDGKYYAKVFVSPFSTLAEKYTSSKMNIFKVDNQMITPVEFDAPLVEVIGNGIVISPDQSPVSEVWIKIYNAQGKEVEAVKTNTQGEFKIPALADGQYELRALGAQGYKDSISQIITVSNQMVTGNTALTLTNTQIMGQAKLENDTNVGDVTVLLFDTDKNLISIQDCPDGAYSFGGMVAGTYYLQVRANLGSEIVDSEMMGINFEGTLVNQDLIVQSAYYHGIVLTPQDMPITKGWIHVYVDGEYFKSTLIDANGNFKLELFDPSKEVKIVAEDSTGNYMSSEAMVLSGHVNPVIKVRENVGLLGTLAYGSEILAQTDYYLYDEEGTPIYQSQTNAFGEFRLLDVTFGKYKIIVPIENGYLKGEVNFTADGQTIPFVQLIKGE